MAQRQTQQNDPLDRYMRLYGQLGPEGQTREALVGDELQQRQALEQYARQHGFPSLAAMKLAQDEENQQGGRDLRKQALAESADSSARELANVMSQTGDNVGAKAILNELAKRKGFNVGQQQTGNPLDEKLRKVAQATGGKVPPLLERPVGQEGDVVGPPQSPRGASAGARDYNDSRDNPQFNPSALVQNSAAAGLGKVLGAEAQIAEGQAGGRHITNVSSDVQDPFHSGFFKDAPERLADMTNKTGAYAPTNAIARLDAQRMGAPVPHVGQHLGPDIELPGMNAAQRKQTELTYAPKTAAPGYAGRGMPTPVAGSVRNDPNLTVSKPPNFAPSQLTEPKFATGNPPTNENMAARPELRPATNEEPMATSGLTASPTPATPTAGGDILDNAHIMAGLKALGQYFNVPKLPEEQKHLKLATAP